MNTITATILPDGTGAYTGYGSFVSNAHVGLETLGDDVLKHITAEASRIASEFSVRLEVKLQLQKRVAADKERFYRRFCAMNIFDQTEIDRMWEQHSDNIKI